jgi:uncharacterized protein YqgC (DUF456 family)
MNTVFYVIAAALIAVGLVGAIVPALPGIALIFGGIWLFAGVDRYRHLGLWWLLGIAVIGVIGLPGLLLGPFVGAVLGELAAGYSALRSAHVGVCAWVGLFFGTIFKLVSSLMMVALFGAGWWWNGRS